MATTTYVPIQTQIVTSNTTSLTFGTGGTLPQTYTDLVLVMGNVNNTDAAQILLQFNGDTGSNYSRTTVNGDGSRAASHQNSNQTAIMLERDGYPSFDGSKDYTGIWHIMNYANTTTYKTVIGRGSSASTGVVASVGLWRSTAAITSFKIQPAYGYQFTYGTFTLYGIANADTGAKATGGVITYDGTYYYHTFGASGTFTPTQNLTNVDYLVIAGGGAGGGGDNGSTGSGGGGGAGGLRSTVDVTGGGGSLESKLSLTSSTAYTITVGAGGAGVVERGNSGGNSSIAGSGLTTITSTGGGGGGTGASGNTAGLTGGSGGGNGARGGSAGSGTSNQGYAGSATSPGGGGGAGETGGTDASGAGGDGVAIPNMANATGTGVLTYYAGGGSMGTNSTTPPAAGDGGGGIGGQATAGFAGVVNTGSGGGGGGWSGVGTAGGNGGSGIVIIRYAK